MAKSSTEKLSVYSDVIMSLAVDAASAVSGIEVLASKSKTKKSIRGGGVSVYFLPSGKVTIDLFVNVHHGYNAPDIVSQVQEKVIEEVETSTKYKVHSVNVQIVSIIFPSAH
ncbi:MAG TPA: Asp23/Gls24 family envelope stress response protein [Clostridia bacterium]|nr:Asp23/Gls24 family envelope stress response protein [Clostridia bacterium]